MHFTKPAELGFCPALSSNAKFVERRFGTFLSPNSEPAIVRSSERGTCLSPNSEPIEPGFGPVLYPNSEPAKPGLVLSPNSEPAKPRFGPVLSQNSEPARVQSLEKGTGFFSNSQPDEPGFGPVFSPNSEPARVWSSEIEQAFIQTPNLSNQGNIWCFLGTMNPLNQKTLFQTILLNAA